MPKTPHSGGKRSGTHTQTTRKKSVPVRRQKNGLAIAIKKHPIATVVTIVFVVALAILLISEYHANRPWRVAERTAVESHTEVWVVEGGMLFILPGRPNIRSLPLASTYSFRHYVPGGGMRLNVLRANTSYGRMIDRDNDGHLIFVCEVFINRADPWNGPFIGFKLDDLCERTLDLLPRNINRSPDGLIWISSNYIHMENVVRP
ncbi:hypothetical protein FWD07_02405 [Candidatus Saccharibacteria bacterium]|nr:hypothetical protein [Candidatus Saccharibacteria bacterium]